MDEKKKLLKKEKEREKKRKKAKAIGWQGMSEGYLETMLDTKGIVVFNNTLYINVKDPLHDRYIWTSDDRLIRKHILDMYPFPISNGNFTNIIQHLNYTAPEVTNAESGVLLTQDGYYLDFSSEEKKVLVTKQTKQNNARFVLSLVEAQMYPKEKDKKYKSEYEFAKDFIFKFCDKTEENLDYLSLLLGDMSFKVNDTITYLYGPEASNGKSTMLLYFYALHKTNAVQISSAQLFESFGLQSALNKQLVCLEDIDVKNLTKSIEILKTLTGNRISINRKGKPIVEDTISKTVLMSGNPRMNFKGIDRGFARRLKIFVCSHKFTGQSSLRSKYEQSQAARDYLLELVLKGANVLAQNALYDMPAKHQAETQNLDSNMIDQDPALSIMLDLGWAKGSILGAQERVLFDNRMLRGGYMCTVNTLYKALSKYFVVKRTKQLVGDKREHAFLLQQELEEYIVAKKAFTKYQNITDDSVGAQKDETQELLELVASDVSV